MASKKDARREAAEREGLRETEKLLSRIRCLSSVNPDFYRYLTSGTSLDPDSIKRLVEGCKSDLFENLDAKLYDRIVQRTDAYQSGCR